MTSLGLEYIDSHAHLDFYASEELSNVLLRMKAARTAAISIGTQRQDWPKIEELVARNPDTLLGYTAGLHPSEVKEDWREEIKALEEQLAHPKKGLLGIGECGLDFFRLDEKANPQETVAWQRAAFDAQLSLIRQTQLPVVIHSRGAGAFAEIVRMIDASGIDWRRFVFHCFSEGPKEISELNARGARGSFTGIITFKNGQQARDAMLAQGVELLMVETDSPYLSPEPYRGQPNDPSRVNWVAKKAAEVLGVSLGELEAKLLKTTREFFNI